MIGLGVWMFQLAPLEATDRDRFVLRYVPDGRRVIQHLLLHFSQPWLLTGLKQCLRPQGIIF